jgi:Rhodopirellula transposase DDE domain
MVEVPQAALIRKILPTLNEAQVRWYVAKEVLALGRGGLKRMHELTGLSQPTIIKGIRELQGRGPLGPPGRVRRPGGGRKRVEVVAPGLRRHLERLLDETTAGDPMSPLKWTSKSTYRLAAELTRAGYRVDADTVGRLLKDWGYSLQANVKTKEGSGPPERDAQFRYIARQVQRFQRRGWPVISVDTKKKERIGAFKNPGRTWRRVGQPREVEMHDFPDLGIGTAIPYGTYDLQRNQGLVNVGITHETAEFAVESIRRWWQQFGRRHYPRAGGLLICADGGGSNGSRSRAWKFYLQDLVDWLRVPITVCHYPPGTSKWNKIEHRMFAFISLNWRGEPLVSYETVVNLISRTTTRTGLRIAARLDTRAYEPKVKISDQAMAQLRVTTHRTHPQWNYTIDTRVRNRS